MPGSLAPLWYLSLDRNLDFGQLFMWNITTQSWGLSDSLKKVSVNINYIRNGTILFKGTTLAGHVGIITGIYRLFINYVINL